MRDTSEKLSHPGDIGSASRRENVTDRDIPAVSFWCQPFRVDDLLDLRRINLAPLQRLLEDGRQKVLRQTVFEPALLGLSTSASFLVYLKPLSTMARVL